MTLSSDALTQFRDQGFVLLGAIAGREQVAALRAAEERFRLAVGYGTERNATLRVNVHLCDRSQPVRRFCTEGPHVDALLDLIGPDVCLTHQQFVTKLPDVGELRSDIPLHQDNGYGELDPMTDVTIWLPLVDTDEHNGALQVVPGSHELGLLDHRQASINPVLRETSGAEPTSLPLRAGHGVAFSGLLLHGSGPNRSSEARPAMYARYCEPQTLMVGEGKTVDEGGLAVLESPYSWMVAGEA